MFKKTKYFGGIKDFYYSKCQNIYFLQIIHFELLEQLKNLIFKKELKATINYKKDYANIQISEEIFNEINKIFDGKEEFNNG